MSSPPEGAFSRAMEYNSIDWEGWFPAHCYVCHIASEPEDVVPHDRVLSTAAGVMTCVAGCRGCACEDDTSRCGPGCAV